MAQQGRGGRQHISIDGRWAVASTLPGASIDRPANLLLARTVPGASQCRNPGSRLTRRPSALFDLLNRLCTYPARLYTIWPVPVTLKRDL